ncbi:MAG TPA: DUF6508 domain-containing protein [Allosphingosinicella sp.]|jgi:hypothetical protein
MALPPISTEQVDLVLQHAPRVAALAQATGAVTGHPDVGNMLLTMDETEFTAPFDWLAEFQDRPELLQDPAIVDTADLETLRKIMTAHIRIDRQSGYHLDQLIASGYWQRCLNRLAQLRTTMA